MQSNWIFGLILKFKSELFPELFKFCLYDIHMQSYN